MKGGNIQTLMVESKQKVQPPVNIGHIQSLDMYDWKGRRTASDAGRSSWTPQSGSSTNSCLNPGTVRSKIGRTQKGCMRRPSACLN